MMTAYCWLEFSIAFISMLMLCFIIINSSKNTQIIVFFFVMNVLAPLIYVLNLFFFHCFVLQRVEQGFLHEGTCSEYVNYWSNTHILITFCSSNNVRMTSGFGSLLLFNLASSLDFVRVLSTSPHSCLPLLSSASQSEMI